MTQEERKNAAMRIDGYYNPPTAAQGQTIELQFARARSECIDNLKHALANTEALTLTEFLDGRRGK